MADKFGRSHAVLEALQHPVFVISTLVPSFGEISFANAAAKLQINGADATKSDSAPLSATVYRLQDCLSFLTCGTLPNALHNAQSGTNNSQKSPILQFVQSTGSPSECFQLFFNPLPTTVNNRRDEIIVSLIKTHVPASVLATPFLNDHEKVADLVDNAPLTIHCLGEDKRFIYSNKFEHEKLGYEPGELFGKHVSELHIARNSEAVVNENFRRSINKERLCENHVRFRGNNGKEFDMILTSNARLKRNGEPGFEYTRSYLRDDSERKLVEKLERLKQLRALAKAETATRDRLIRNIFHELKTPLQVMLMSTPMLPSSTTITMTVPGTTHIHDNSNNNNHEEHQVLMGVFKDIAIICDESYNNASSLMVYADLSQLTQSAVNLALSCSVRAGQHVNMVVDCCRHGHHQEGEDHEKKEEEEELYLLPADGLIDRALFHLIRNAISYSADNCQVTLTVKFKSTVTAPLSSSTEQVSDAVNDVNVPAATAVVQPSFIQVEGLSSLTIDNNVNQPSSSSQKQQQQQQAVESICFEVSNHSLTPVDEATLLSRVKKEQLLQQLSLLEEETTDENEKRELIDETDAMLHRSLSSSKPEGFGLNVVHKVAASLGGSIACSVTDSGHRVTVTLEVPAVRRPCSASASASSCLQQSSSRMIMIGAAPPVDASNSMASRTTMNKKLTPRRKKSGIMASSSSSSATSPLATACINNNNPASSLPTTAEELKKQQLTILVVDDTPSIQKILKRTIESLGHICVCANHGQHALEIMIAAAAREESSFDAVLMDLRMPVMDGLTATAEIRKLPHYHSLPIAVLSADTTSTVKLAAIEAGADVFFEKPISTSFLKDYIDSLLLLLPLSFGL